MYGDRSTMKGLTYCPYCKTYHPKHLVCPAKRVALDANTAQVEVAETLAAAEVVEDVVDETPAVEETPKVVEAPEEAPEALEEAKEEVPAEEPKPKRKKSAKTEDAE